MTTGRGNVSTRYLGTVLVVVAVVLAGCVGGIGGDGGNGDGATPTPTTTGADGTDGTDETDGTDGTDGGTATTETGGTATTATTSDAARGGFGDYEFSEGDTFVYSAALSNTSSRLDVLWRVTDVSGEELTVEVSYGFEGNYGETKTFEGTKEEIFAQLSYESDHLGETIFLALRFAPSIAEGHSLSVGNTWTATPDELPQGFPTSFGEYQAEVTGTAEYAGVECTNIRLINRSASDSRPVTHCVNPEYPFSLAMDTEGTEGTDFRFEGTSTEGSGGTDETTTTTSDLDELDVQGTATSDLDGLEIVDHRLVVGEGEVIAEGALGAAVTVENTGDQTAKVVFEYSFEVILYDESGTEIVSGFAGKLSRSNSTIAPGESVEVILTVGAYDPDRVDRYEITLTCRDFDEGVYCE